MKELVLKDSNEIIVKDFLARRYAQLYVDILNKEGHEAAEEWVIQKIPRSDRKVFQHYVITEMVKQGYTDIIPGEQ